MAVVLLPEDADPVSHLPAFTAQQTRQAFSALIRGATPTRPLGGRSGVRPGTPDATVALSGASNTTWTVAAHSGVLDTEAPVAAAPYLYATDGADSGTVPAANAANPRIDVIWISPNDNPQDGSGLESGVIGYTQGVAASSPAAPTAGQGTPALPARAMVLAQITVPKATTGNPSVTFVAPYTGAAGCLLNVRTPAERDSQAPYDGSPVYRQDVNIIQVYNGASWDSWYPAAALESFGGTPLIGTYDPTKPIRKLIARKLGNSDGSGYTAATPLPAGATALLAVDLGMNLITGQTILVRTDVCTLAQVVLQLRNAASPYAALTGTAYDFNHTIWCQV